MKLEKNKKYFTVAVYVFLTAASIICFLMCIINYPAVKASVGKVLDILSPFFYGFVIAYVMNPVCETLKGWFASLFEKKKPHPKFKSAVCITLTYIFLLGLLTVFGLLLFPSLGKSVVSLYNSLADLLTNAKSVLGTFYDRVGGLTLPSTEDDVFAVIDKVYAILKDFYPQLIGSVSRIALESKNIFLGLLISIYMLADKERFKKRFRKLGYALFPANTQKRIEGFFKDAHVTFGGFITGKLLDSMIIGVLCFIGLEILGIPYPVLIAVIVGVTNIIPFFGPIIGAVPSALIILLVSPVKALWFIIFIIILQQLDGNLIGPKILGQVTGVEAFFIIFSLLLFGGLFGIVGMLIAIPLFSLVYKEVKSVCEKRLFKKGLPTLTDSYDKEPEIPKNPKDDDTDYDGIE